MKLQKITNSKEHFDKIVKLDLPISKAFDILTWYKKLEPELSAYEEQRKSLLLKYSTEDEENKEMRKFNSEEDMKTFYSEMSILGDKEVEDAPKLSQEDVRGCKLSISDLAMLDFIIE